MRSLWSLQDSGRRVSEASAAKPGCLSADPGVRAARAELLLGKGDTLAAFRICADAMQRDSLCTECLDVYLACLVELGKRNQLFQLGHRYFSTTLVMYDLRCVVRVIHLPGPRKQNCKYCLPFVHVIWLTPSFYLFNLQSS